MPSISWNEIRNRALAFSRTWSEATREQADKLRQLPCHRLPRDSQLELDILVEQHGLQQALTLDEVNRLSTIDVNQLWH